jgi:hypothetical protein
MVTVFGAVGIVGGAIISAWRGLRRRRAYGVVLPLLVIGLTLPAFGLSPWLYLTAAVAGLDGLVNPFLNAHSQAIWQNQTPREMQGRSFRAHLQGKTPRNWRTSMYYRYWMHLADHGVPAHYGIRTQRYKLIFYYGLPLGMAGAVNRPTEPEWEMFDLEKDPHEMRNVYADPAYAPVVRDLKAQLLKLKDAAGDSDQPYPELVELTKKNW